MDKTPEQEPKQETEKKEEEAPISKKDQRHIGLSLLRNLENREEEFSDKYDIAKLITKVHSQHAKDAGINEDFILSSLTPYEADHIRKQMRTITQIEIFLTIEGNVEDKEIKDKIKKMREMTIFGYLNEITIMAILSRGEQGKVLNSMLNGIWSEPSEAQDQKSGVINGLRKRLHLGGK